MELNYTLLKEDYLAFNLYHTSKNPQIKKQRTRSYIIMIICFVLMAFFLHTLGIEFYYSVPVFAILLIIYPLRIGSIFKNSMKRQVEMNYGDAYAEQVFVTVSGEYIEIKDYRTLSRVNIPYIKGFSEIEGYFFIKLTSLSYIIIPKRHFQDTEFIRKQLFDLSKAYNLPFDQELDWKWK